MKIGQIASSAEYGMDKQFQSLLIFWISNFFTKFLKLPIYSKIPEISN